MCHECGSSALRRRTTGRVNRPDGPTKFYLPTDTLTDDLFPGLSLPLNRVFV